MDLIKTGIGIGKTIRNVGRLRDIVSVFARHGFAEFISIGVTSKIPDFVLPSSQKDIKRELEERGDKSLGKTLGYRLRLCFEELGPAFIKFGQLLGSREDLFDKGFIEEMHLLRDKVKPVSLKISIKTIEESLGKKFSEVFESIDEKPVGTASIGVVYKAKLLTGEDVVVKVRRPKISKEISRDFSILSFLANQVEKASEELRYLGLSRLVHDFAISLQNELNFNIEAMSCTRLKSNLERHDKDNLFHLPKIYEEYTSEKIMVMEHLKGTPFSDKKIQESIEVLRPKLDTAVLMFMKTFLQDGFFHADLHGGNFFYLENGQMLSQSDADDVRVSGLVTNIDSLSTWNGPYISNTSPRGLGLFPESNYYALWLQKSSTWSSNINRNTCALASNDCAEWHVIYVKDALLVPQMISVFEKLDQIIDGGDGELAGNMRYSKNTANATAIGWVMYRGLNHPRVI